MKEKRTYSTPLITVEHMEPIRVLESTPVEIPFSSYDYTYEALSNESSVLWDNGDDVWGDDSGNDD